MEFKNGQALVIGVAEYDEITRLHEVVENDACDVAAVLRSRNYCSFPAENVRILLNAEATLSAIKDALADLAAAAGADDTVVVFFSGHGARFERDDGNETSALVPFDAKPSDLEGTTLPEAEVSAALAEIRARRLLVLIDACHAGGAGVLKGMAGDIHFGFGEKSLQRLAEGVGRVIVASSRASETSIALRGTRNSVFTGHLLEALSGKAHTMGDGLIRVFDVFNYVAEQVARTVPGRQHPIFKASELENNFPIALDCAGAKSAEIYVRAESWRELEHIMADLYPTGPMDQDIWTRAGGDVSRIKLSGTGRANWFAALRTLQLGGGGNGITRRSLVEATLGDYPHHPELGALKSK